MLTFALLIVKGSPPTIGNGMRQLPLSQARGDCEIKRGRAVQVPVRYPDIGRPSLARRLVANMGRTILGAALMLRPRWQQVCLFNFGLEARGFGASSQKVPELVVPFDSVASTRAHPGMVPISVSGAIAQRASEVGISNGQAQAEAHHDPK